MYSRAARPGPVTSLLRSRLDLLPFKVKAVAGNRESGRSFWKGLSKCDSQIVARTPNDSGTAAPHPLCLPPFIWMQLGYYT